MKTNPLALRLIEECKAAQNKKLDLGKCGLTSIPEEVFELVWLEELLLCDQHWNFERTKIFESNNKGGENKISKLPKEIGQLKKLTYLNLSYGQLLELPREIGQLKGLISLNLNSNQLQSLPTEIGQLKSLSSLVLSSNQLQSLPAEIGQLKGLSNLNISSNPTLKDYSILLKLDGLSSLDLSSNQLQSLPTEIGQLKGLSNLNINSNPTLKDYSTLLKLEGLTSLSFSSNQLQGLPAEIGQLKGLISLNLNSNQLQSLPTEIGQLKGLTSLNLYSNQLQSLPAEIGQLKGLTSLSLSNNQLQSLPAEIGQLKGLTSLSLYSNQLQSLPAEIGQLKGLTSLSLPGNQLQSLPAEIGQLKSLTSLDLYLYSNQLQSLPAEIGQLKGLTSLDLSSNQLQSLPAEIGQLKGLTSLSLYSNQLQSLPTEIGQLKGLTSLDLYSNQLQSLPTEIGQLKGLTSLNFGSNPTLKDYSTLIKLDGLTSLSLNSNQLREIPIEVKRLGNLSALYFEKNKLEEIPEFIKTHNSLKYLSLLDNPLKGIPSEIKVGINSGRNQRNNALPDVLQWFAELEKGSKQNYQFKLLILGNVRVGKSCIVDALQGRPFDKGKKSTHAILLEKWTPPSEGDNPNLDFLIWDFGGQEIYHSTHRWFMRSRAVYLVVWDRESEKEATLIDPLTGWDYDNHTIPYWMKSIRAENKNIPILLVENKLDKYAHKKSGLSEFQLPPKYRVGIEFAQFSAKKRERYLNKLIAEIQYITESLDEYGQEMPLSWYNVRKRILDMFIDNEKPTIQKLEKADFTQWCAEEKVLPKSVDTLLRFLHRTGILYLDIELLENTILIDQQWAIDAIYEVLDRDGYFFKDINRGNGRFAQFSLFREWQQYEEKDRQLFLKFMLSCNLCFKINDKELGDDNEYAIPQLMPKEPSPELLNKWKKDYIEVFYLEFQYDFLHYAAIQSFIVNMGRKTSIDFIWKNGISINWEDKNSDALVTADISKKIIHIRTKGTHKDYLLSAIRNLFNQEMDFDKEDHPQINVSNDGLNYAELEELKRTLKANNENIQIINQKTGKKSFSKAVQFRWATEINKDADLSKLPNRPMQIRTSSTPKTQIKKDVTKEVANPFIIEPDKEKNIPIQKSITTKIYFSYAWNDEDNQEREQLVGEVFNELKAQGLNIHRDKENATYGKYISEFMKKIGRGELIIVFISKKYLHSEYCMRELLNIAGKSDWNIEEFSKRILPIQVESLAYFKNREAKSQLYDYWIKKAEKAEIYLKKYEKVLSDEEKDELDAIIDMPKKLSRIITNLTNLNRGNIELYRKDNFEIIKNQIKQRLSASLDNEDADTISLALTNAFEQLNKKLSNVELNILDSIKDLSKALKKELQSLENKIDRDDFNEALLNKFNQELIENINTYLTELPKEVIKQWKEVKESTKEIADVKSKFKLSIPIVPGILKHETELNKDLPIFKWARKYWSDFNLDTGLK